ncbi:MAG: hypothetical protein HUK25_05750, partial [Treponema sp.]|nr:hypothetical protein [Treponema sp.]
EEKIEEVEDESETKEDIISEVVDVPESNEVIAEVTETEDEELFEDSVENAIPPEDEVSVSVITPEPAEEFIESEEEEVPSDEIREISNNEETIEEEIQEEVLEDAQTVTETEEIEDIEECEEAETAEEDLEEVLEAEEEMPAAVPEETSEPAPVIPDFHISEDDLTFASDTEDGFATVDNVFAEELRFGEPYIKKPIFDEIETDLTFNFELSSPDFGITEELLPVEDNSFFSMTGFGANNNNVQELDASPETIEEIDGIYSISRNLEIPKMDLDKDFKKLVDAVLG